MRWKCTSIMPALASPAMPYSSMRASSARRRRHCLEVARRTTRLRLLLPVGEREGGEGVRKIRSTSRPSEPPHPVLLPHSASKTRVTALMGEKGRSLPLRKSFALLATLTHGVIRCLPVRKAMQQPAHRPLKVVIIGAGIGGLAAAIALRQRGIEVALYERSQKLEEVGAGLQIGPNGVKVLRALGLEDELM